MNKKTIVITEEQAQILKDGFIEEKVPVYDEKRNNTIHKSVRLLRLTEQYLGKADFSVVPDIWKGTVNEFIFKINACINEEYGISNGVLKIASTILSKVNDKTKNNDYEIIEQGKGYQVRQFNVKLKLPNSEETFGDYYLYNREPEGKKNVTVNVKLINYNFKNQSYYKDFIKENGDDFASYESFTANKFMSLGTITVSYASVKEYIQPSFYSDLEHEITHFYQQNRMNQRYPNSIKMTGVNNGIINDENEAFRKISRILYLCDDGEQEAIKHGLYAYAMSKNEFDDDSINRTVKEDTAFKYLAELETLIEWLKANRNETEQIKNRLKQHYNMRSVNQLIRYAEHKLERFYRLFARTVKKIKKDKGLTESIGRPSYPFLLNFS